MKRIITITFGVLGALAGLGFICPALAQLRLQGALSGLSVVLLLLGLILAAAGGAATWRGIRSSRP